MIRSNLPLALMLCTAVFGVASPARSQSLPPDADAYINAGIYANTNFGSTGHLAVKNDGAGSDATRKSYIRFDISSIAKPVAPVTLHMPIGFVSSGGFVPATTHFVNVYGLNDGHSGEAWSESGITWNNAPGNNTSSGSGVTSASFLGTYGVPPTTTVGDAIDFSSATLRTFLDTDTDGLVTLIWTDATGVRTGASVASGASRLVVGEVCGDGFVTGTEECDDGNLVQNDGCNNFCTADKVCDASDPNTLGPLQSESTANTTFEVECYPAGIRVRLGTGEWACGCFLNDAENDVFAGDQQDPPVPFDLYVNWGTHPTTGNPVIIFFEYHYGRNQIDIYVYENPPGAGPIAQETGISPYTDLQGLENKVGELLAQVAVPSMSVATVLTSTCSIIPPGQNSSEGQTMVDVHLSSMHFVPLLLPFSAAISSVLLGLIGWRRLRG